MRDLIGRGLAAACHDVSDGGVLVAVAEMALAGGTGAWLEVPEDGPAPFAWAFGEDQGRYVLVTGEPDAVLAAPAAAGVPAAAIGQSGGDALTLGGDDTISLGELRAAHEEWLPEYMTAEDRRPGTPMPMNSADIEQLIKQACPMRRCISRICAATATITRPM